MSDIQITSEIPSDLFTNGCAEASSLGLPPGVAPIKVILTEGADRFPYAFSHREQTSEGETTAWVYTRIRGEGKVPHHTTISILND